MSFFSQPNGVAERERQLAALLEAVNQAQQSAISLCSSPDSAREVKLLFGRLEAVRLEIEQLHLGIGAVSIDEIDSRWTGLVPWRTVPEC